MCVTNFVTCSTNAFLANHLSQIATQEKLPLIIMAAYQQFLLTEGEEKLEKVLRLSTEGSSNDPESEPYKSKYKAREIVDEVKNRAENFMNENQDDESWTFLMATLDYLLGVNYLETEELASGQELLCKLTENLEPIKLDERVCNLLQCAYNQLGILWTGRRENEKVAQQTLSRVENPDTIRKFVPCGTRMALVCGLIPNPGPAELTEHVKSNPTAQEFCSFSRN